MAITHSTDGVDSAAADPTNFSVSIPAGTDTIVVAVTGANMDGNLTSITYDPDGDNVAFDPVQSGISVVQNNFTYSNALYYLDHSFASGTQTIRIEYSGAQSNGRCACWMLDGTDTATDSLNTSGEYTSTTEDDAFTISLSGLNSDDLVILSGCAGGSPSAFFTTEEFDTNAGGFWHSGGSNIGTTTPGATADYPAYQAAAFLAAAAGGASPHRFLPLLGVG